MNPGSPAFKTVFPNIVNSAGIVRSQPAAAALNPNNAAIKISNIDLSAANGVALPHVAAIDITSGNFTIAYWLQIITQPDPGSLILPWIKSNALGDNTDVCYSFFTGDGTNTGYSSEYSITVTAGASVTDDEVLATTDLSQWTPFAFVKSSTGISTWVGGVQASPETANVLPMLSSSTSFYRLFCDPNSAPSAQPCDIRMADFRFYTSALSGANIANLAAKIDVTTTLSTRLKFNNDCLDSVGSMNGTKGALVTYTLGPSGLPP